MKRPDLFFLAVRLPLDYFAVVGAAITAYFLRFQTFIEYRPATEIISSPTYFAIALFGAFLWLAAFALAGLYTPGRGRTLDDVSRIFVGCSTAVVALIMLIFFRRELFASRFIILAVWALSFLYVFGERMLLRAIQTFLLSRGIGSRRIAIVGHGRAAEAIAKQFKDHPSVGYTAATTVPDLSQASLEKLKRMRTGRKGLDEIFLADPRVDQKALGRLLVFSDAYQVTIRYSADIFLGRRLSLDVAMFGGVPFVEMKKTSLDGWGRIYKRAFDIIITSFLLILLSPIMLFIALIIKIDSEGPVFFSQVRIGERGEKFRFHKFRSMRIGAEKEWKRLAGTSDRPGPVPKIKDDPRITSVGQFLRRYSLDELPQLWDVLIGTMSLIGPRPHLPQEVEMYTSAQRKVLTIKPGISGLAQISGRADLSFDEEAQLDVSYIERWSPKLDWSILLKTPLAVFSRKGAY